MKNLKKRVVNYFAQIYANVLIGRLQMLVNLEDQTQFWSLYEVASMLNAYCVVFHDIYLD